MINMTPDACKQFKKLFKEKDLPETSAIRFTIKGGGCSGFQLDVSLEPSRRFDMPKKTDLKFISEGIRILIDKKSHLFLDGMTVRYQKQDFGHKFVYDNPNSKGTCGCGESFSI